MMIGNTCRWCALLLALGALLVTPNAQSKPPAGKKKAKPAAAEASPAPEAPPSLEPKAVDILKAASSRLAAARTMKFTAVHFYESPSRHGHPLAFTTKSEVTLQRPDKLRVIMSADGPASEFYYDGKKMMAYAPAENLVAVADAPPTIDAALEQAYHSAAIYFPFDDWIVTDPYKEMSEGMNLAYYIGQSKVVGGTTTDMVAYIDHGVFIQAWIGAEDMRFTWTIRSDCAIPCYSPIGNLTQRFQQTHLPQRKLPARTRCRLHIHIRRPHPVLSPRQKASHLKNSRTKRS